ncbi:anthranilate synthase component I family protein [Psychroflexus halocasei]|uniref:Para-aminobenzoate synthetase component 1 n=1 Tax=Psychroflexus halocasei TaxID=908615 RepID=A0A1H3WP20_9FLAO|nr:anthranilate synthase component I family protein [Psychroflexus halocasei]SDZ88927.1 para-aminobenzoate synthetase component 1 [Psychroflexus halocasei]
MRHHIQREIINPLAFKEKLFHWASKSSNFTILEGQQMGATHHQYDCIIGVGELSSLTFHDKVDFDGLDDYHQKTQDWLLTYISYDVKNSIENLKSQNSDDLKFPLLKFIQPKKLLCLKNNLLSFHYLNDDFHEIDKDFKNINETLVEESSLPKVDFINRMSKKEYFENASQLLKHIQRGDIYEVNFCQEFYANDISFNCLQAYKSLRDISKAPFSVFSKVDTHYVISASPERYISKSGNTLISQPIKGTARRDSDSNIDHKIKVQLKNDPKERAENIMIVDLVRNDLSKIAKSKSVEVQELCKIYSFEQVHQMISTITCQLKDNVKLSDILKASFPMGSMTGAPKYKAMELAEKYETKKRGLYSGSVGYITPDFDFDFNVVIRSLLYNADARYLSYMVGGALTAKSIIEKEYEECKLKGKAMKKIFGQSS